jgi:uncharacterized damage-inducible protein DinB
MGNMLQMLVRYSAWANQELFDKLDALDAVQWEAELLIARRLIGHLHVVSRIFAGHLQGETHGFTSTNFETALPLGQFREAVAATDQWYIDYVDALSAEARIEPVAFTFTDGDRGSMTREEMLVHVSLHAGYHRGEIGRLLTQASVTPPWDTLAVYLHQNEPARRDKGFSQDGSGAG